MVTRFYNYICENRVVHSWEPQSCKYVFVSVVLEILVDPLAGVETNGYLVNWLTG